MDDAAVEGRAWAAPVAEAPISATVRVPGSKSATNRALVLAALADGPSRVRGALDARDTRLMVEALRALGARFSDGGRDAVGNVDWIVQPAGLPGVHLEKPVSLDVGLAGTVMRFVPPVAALAMGTVRIDGDPRARERPLGPMITALRSLGVACDDARGFLPLVVRGRGSVTGGAVSIDASTSSQFVSGLLLAAPKFGDGLVLTHTGRTLPSVPHIAMTLQMLRAQGVDVNFDAEASTWSVSASQISALDQRIEPDLSNAGPFLAAAMVTGGRVAIPDWPARTTQAGDALRGLFTQMGAHVDRSGDGLTLRGPGTIRGIDVDLHDVGELAPTLVAVAAVASSPSRFRGIGHLRGHETDRLAALAEMIGALGGRVDIEPDGLAIHPVGLRGTTVSSYGDHRMATAAAILGLVVPGVLIEDIATTRKTLPDFPGMWTSMASGGS